MNDLRTPDEVREILTLYNGDRFPTAALDNMPQVCRDYLTLWDELANERSISDRLLERIAELESQIAKGES